MTKTLGLSVLELLNFLGDQMDQLWLVLVFNLSLLPAGSSIRAGESAINARKRGERKIRAGVEESGRGTLTARCLRAIEGEVWTSLSDVLVTIVWDFSV